MYKAEVISLLRMSNILTFKAKKCYILKEFFDYGSVVHVQFYIGSFCAVVAAHSSEPTIIPFVVKTWV